MWFAMWLGVAFFVAQPRARVPLAILGAVGAAAGAWALTLGPLAGRLTVMDPAWLATLVTKDYLFPLQWPVDVWLLNLGYIPVILVVWRRRSALGLAAPREAAVVTGCLSLLLVFGVALPLTAVPVALAVQLQTPRIFWMLDFLAVVYAVWAIAEGGVVSARRARLAAIVIILASLSRGIYVMAVRFPDRPVAQVRVADDDWGRVMAWAWETVTSTG
jgi:hypothetical protein